MRGFSKFFTILFIFTLLYNVFIIVHLHNINQKIDNLELALNGIKTKSTENLTTSQINLNLKEQLLLQLDWEAFLFCLFTINGIFLILLLYQNWHFSKDTIRIKTKTPFQDLSEEKQNQLLNNVFCNVCLNNRNTQFKSEKILLGSPYIIVNCKVCNTGIKVKDD